MNAIPLIFNAPKANINVNSVGPINVNSIRTNNKLINATQGMNIGGAAGMLGGGGLSNEVQLRQEVNTSLVALKREAFNLETLINQAAKTLTDVNNRIAALENVQGDYVKKTDVTNTIESGNMNPVTSNAVATSNAMPVDTVTSGNIHSVTSNAVYNQLQGIKFKQIYTIIDSVTAGQFYILHYADIGLTENNIIVGFAKEFVGGDYYFDWEGDIVINDLNKVIIYYCTKTQVKLRIAGVILYK